MVGRNVPQPNLPVKVFRGCLPDIAESYYGSLLWLLKKNVCTFPTTNTLRETDPSGNVIEDVTLEIILFLSISTCLKTKYIFLSLM